MSKSASRTFVKDNQFSDRWSEVEVKELLKGIHCYGHLDVDSILKKLPMKNSTHVKLFMRKLKAIAQNEKGIPPELIFHINNWIETVEQEYLSNPDTNPKGPLELSMVLKMLSLDGVLENHPLPEDADGVDYGACYRILNQAALGHPIQPVNKETLDVLYECFFEVSQLVDRNLEILDELKNALHLNQCSAELSELYKGSMAKLPGNKERAPLVTDPVPTPEAKKKSLKTYVRKPKQSLASTETGVSSAENSNIPVKQISVVVDSSSSNSITCSLNMDGTSIPLQLPNRMEVVTTQEPELQVLQDIAYNPLKLPVKWLKNSSYKINRKKKMNRQSAMKNAVL